MSGLLDTIQTIAGGLLGIRPAGEGSDVIPHGLLGAPRTDEERKVFDREVDMLARMMIAEAEGEGREGMQMVGNVAWNRMHDTNPVHGFKNQDTMTKVLRGLNQFEGLNNENYKNADKYKKGSLKDRLWQQAKRLASHQLMDNLPDITGGRVFYRNPDAKGQDDDTKWFQKNYLAKNLQPGKRIGNHMLYDWVEDSPDTWKKEEDIKAIKTAYSDL